MSFFKNADSVLKVGLVERRRERMKQHRAWVKRGRNSIAEDLKNIAVKLQRLLMLINC
jgi:hypothetical protein